MPHGGPHNTTVPADFAITDFIAKLDALGSYAKRNRFTVQIIPPRTLNSNVPASQIEFLVKAVSFPARSFGATTYRRGGKFGLEVPYEVTEENVSITFLGTNDWKLENFGMIGMSIYKVILHTICNIIKVI